MADPLAERRQERERLRSLAREYVRRLKARMPVRAAALVGSVARGDFNLWSDVDVVVVADDLPERVPDRALLLGRDAPPGVQPIGFTTEEFERAFARGDPLAREAVSAGQRLKGPISSRGSRRGLARCRRPSYRKGASTSRVRAATRA